jgi:general L-amino acid transport system substrate-binding protein
VTGPADLRKEQTDMSKASWIRRGGLSLAALAGFALPAAAGTLDSVKQRGMLQCGVSEGLYGFSEKDAQGTTGRGSMWISAAPSRRSCSSDAAKVAFYAALGQPALRRPAGGKVDLLARNSTWTLGREAELGLAFAGVTYHDGQGFLAMRSLKVDRMRSRSTRPRSASRPAPRRSSISPTSSAPIR